MIVTLIDDDAQFWRYFGHSISEEASELWIRADFEHVNPINTYNSKLEIDVMNPSFLEIIRWAKKRAHSVVILSDATFISNLAYELMELPLPQKRDIFQEDGKVLYMWILSGSPEEHAKYESRELSRLLNDVRRAIWIRLPWIMKPINGKDILNLQPWQ